MKTRIETVIKDLTTSRDLDLPKPYERFESTEEDFFLDGPVSRRVAVIDFDPVSGTLTPPVPFCPPEKGRTLGCYRVADPNDVRALDMIKVSVFGTVLKTMKMYEEPDNLGRRLTWAFDAPQLLVVPRAGRWENAYYERESRSLQFFYFPSSKRPDVTVYTALSHDIVAHETGHAILDGIAPDLYNAVSPQALAMHEAIADITALLMAFRLRDLRTAVLNQSGGSIEDTSAFSGIGEEFATEKDSAGRGLYLRDLRNDKSLQPNAGKNLLTTLEPHALSEVLSGALYAVLRKMYAAEWKKVQKRAPGKEPVESSGLALFTASERFKRMVLRALDYLPPGEASFADLGRAIVASDEASYPDARDADERSWFRAECVKRGFVATDAELDVGLPARDRKALEASIQKIDLGTLVASDWVAYEFANRNRRWLHIPAGVSFHIPPRLDVTKLYYRRDDASEPDEAGKTYKKVGVRECILKVRWDEQEPSGLGPGRPASRRVTAGTMLAIDWDSKTIRARLTSDASDGRRRDRDRYLRALDDADLLRFDGEALGPDGSPLPSFVPAEALDGVMAVRGTGRLLHVAPYAAEEDRHEH